MRQKGFTLIELMVVVAIIAVLSAIALPAYQDYVVRAQVAEGISLSNGARMAIAVYYGDNGEFPADNVAAGLAPPGSIVGNYTESVTIDGAGNISVLFGGRANAKLQGKILSVRATDNGGSLRWSCGGAGFKVCAFDLSLILRCRLLLLIVLSTFQVYSFLIGLLDFSIDSIFHFGLFFVVLGFGFYFQGRVCRKS